MTSALLPRYQRRVREVNEAVVGTYLAGGNTRRIRRALQPLLKAAPLSKSAVSRVVATLKDGLAAWMARPLTELDVVYLYLDALRKNALHIFHIRRDNASREGLACPMRLLILEICGVGIQKIGVRESLQNREEPKPAL
jgi:hypothetical protein